MFVLKNAEACPLTCELRSVADKDISGDEHFRIKDDWIVTIDQSEVEGYDAVETEVYCKNTDDSASFKFDAKQIERCVNRLSAKPAIAVKEMPVLKWKQDTNMSFLKRYRTWTTLHMDVIDLFFNNDNSDDKCPINTCKLMKQGCQIDEEETSASTAKIR